MSRYILENDKGNKLDTLLEEKSQNSLVPISPSTIVTKEPYKRVYPEWKPSTTLETTDVVGTIEAISGMTCELLYLHKFLQKPSGDGKKWMGFFLNQAWFLIFL